MTEQEKIIRLAEQCDFYDPGGLPSNWAEGAFIASPLQIEAFYHKAQREAFKRAALVCDERRTYYNRGAAEADEAENCAEAIRKLIKE